MAVKDFNYDSFKKLVPKTITINPSMKTNMTFLHVHYIAYPKLSKTSKVTKVMYDRVNMIRQMVPGLKKTRDGINELFKQIKTTDKEHVKFQAVLMAYLELLRKAERDRQKWIKDEVGYGNDTNVTTMLKQQDLDDVIRI